MLQLTIHLDDNSKQVINMGEKSLMRNEKTRKTPQEINSMCEDIACDLKRDYKSFNIAIS